MSDFSPKKLASALVSKHERLITEYAEETGKAKEITMLKEKRDQLKHWVADAGGKGKFVKELGDVDGRLAQMTSSFKPKPQSHYAGLKDKIEEHRKARDYLKAKIGELKS